MFCLSLSDPASISSALKTQAMQMLLPPSSKRNMVSCASLLSSLSAPQPPTHSHHPPAVNSSKSLFGGTSFPSIHQHDGTRSRHHEVVPMQHTLSTPVNGWTVGTPRASQMDTHFAKTPGGKGWQADLKNHEEDYFRSGGRRVRQASRWKEDWEELEMLVSVLEPSIS